MLNQQTIQTFLTTQISKEPPCFIPEILEHHYDRFLCSLHFSPALKGYPYLKQAFYHEHQNRHNLPALTKDIYEEIAKLYRTQIAAVERCITFSVQKAYQKNPAGFRPFFPDCQKAPSNFRFIKTVSLHLNNSQEQ